MFGSQWADWHSLAAFELETTPVGRRNKLWAVARIVGPAAGGRSLRSKQFVIPDDFVTPLSDIVAELKARNPQTAGASSDATVRGSEQQFGLIGFKVPWVTLGILAVLALIFACEQTYAVDPPGPALRLSVRSLLAMGGLNRSIVTSGGEWYRLLTAPLLHFDLTHIVANGIALLIAGFLLERLVGRAWLLALFVLGALGGSLMSIAVNPPTLTSVGASGAIMCTFATLYVCSFRLPAGRGRSRVQSQSIGVLVPSLLPLAASSEAV